MRPQPMEPDGPNEMHSLRLELHRLRELVKQADLQHIRLRAGLRRALDGWQAERASEGYDEHEDGIELRKLLGGES